MEEIVLKAYGKINIGLDITGRRADGYHLLKTVMLPVGIYDTVTVKKAGKITVSCDNPEVPCDKSNLACKAAACIKGKYGTGGAEIKIEKRIPVAAGMAGGSADAAVVIKAMDVLYGLDMTAEEKAGIALKLGTDVPFCLRDGTYLAEGIGEILTKIPEMPDCRIILVKPDFGVSTKEVYQKYDMIEEKQGISAGGKSDPNESARCGGMPDEEENAQSGEKTGKNENIFGGKTIIHPDMDAVVKGFEHGSLAEITGAAGNVLEAVTAAEHPEINEIKSELTGSGALGSMMSGSGPAVFGIFDKEKDLSEIKERFGIKYAVFEVGC